MKLVSEAELKDLEEHMKVSLGYILTSPPEFQFPYNEAQVWRYINALVQNNLVRQARIDHLEKLQRWGAHE